MKGLTPIILILVSVGVFFFFIDPQKKELDALLEEKNKNDVTIQKARELREARGFLLEKYNKFTDADKTKLLQIIPDTVDNVRLILDINNIAGKYGLVLRGISVSGGPISESTEINKGVNNRAANQEIGTIQLSFSFATDYNTFKIFMKDLENSLRLVDITDFSISASDQDFYNYSLTLNTYWLR